MDLLRIPGLLMYMIRLCLARSAADRRNVKRVRREQRRVEEWWGGEDRKKRGEGREEGRGRGEEEE